ncbi:(Fe-S)-binding protein [Desulfosediminicola ganghwensis]|uniref:(Fe-S)-binding protein n=1 Tax=Desulfosediminicola ganghwensis TaxID=2569540 RepID=UPI0010AC2F41|nr:(Fe-S)-binding protein [Desulfosediminicola ganghwensis]
MRCSISTGNSNNAQAGEKSSRCARCGACTVVCPVYRASGGKEYYSGRGKKYLLEVMGEETPSPVFEDIFSKCLLCGACVAACPRGVDVVEEVRDARSDFTRGYGEHGYQKFLAAKVLEKPELLGVVRRFGRSFHSLLSTTLPADSGLRVKLAMFGGEPVSFANEKIASSAAPISTSTGIGEQLIYFPGCSARYLAPEVLDASRELLGSLGFSVHIPAGLVCCGLAIDSIGEREKARQLAKKNIEALEQQNGRIVVSCGSCYAHLLRYKQLLAGDSPWADRAEEVAGRLVELSRLLDLTLAEKGLTSEKDSPGRVASKKNLRVFYHDPCHLRNELDITREPRNVLKRFSARVELLELADGPQCCGQGGLFHLGAPELSATIRDDLTVKVLAMEPDIITSSCSGCLMQWKSALAAASVELPVLHLSELVSMLSGQKA